MSDHKKSAELDPSVRTAARMLAEELLPAAIAAALAAQKQQAPERRVQLQAPSTEICHQCGQALRTGCEGKHEEMVVYPTRYPEHGEFFQGARINGVTYLSNDENHKVLVPANAVGGIMQLVQGFENNEQETRIGRKAERHSGVVGPSGARTTPQMKGWR